MSKITDAEANATSLDGLVNDNALVPTLRNGPKPSYQYLVDGWNTEISKTIEALNKSRGFRVVGDFATGFTYELFNDTGIDTDGNSWIYVGAGAPNKVVAAGTVPSTPDYEQVTFNAASGVSNANGGSVQDFIYLSNNITTLQEVAGELDVIPRLEAALAVNSEVTLIGTFGVKTKVTSNIIGKVISGIKGKTFLNLDESLSSTSNEIFPLEKSTIKDLTIIGSLPAVSTDAGYPNPLDDTYFNSVDGALSYADSLSFKAIKLYSNQSVVDNCDIEFVNGYAIETAKNNSGVNGHALATGVRNCRILRNLGALNIIEESEYMKFSNNSMCWNIIGVNKRGGNNTLTGNNIDHNRVNFITRSGANNSHGGITGGTMNHGKYATFIADEITNGETVTGVNIFDSGDAGVYVRNSIGLNMTCNFGRTNIYCVGRGVVASNPGVNKIHNSLFNLHGAQYKVYRNYNEATGLEDSSTPDNFILSDNNMMEGQASRDGSDWDETIVNDTIAPDSQGFINKTTISGVSKSRVVIGRPLDGVQFLGAGNKTGAIKIALPITSFNNSMCTFKIDISTSNAKGYSIEVDAYALTGGTWSQLVVKSEKGYTYKVRFGNDNGKPVIYIGQLAEVFTNTLVSVSEVIVHQGAWAQSKYWKQGWLITQEGSAFSSVTAETPDVPTGSDRKDYAGDLNAIDNDSTVFAVSTANRPSTAANGFCETIARQTGSSIRMQRYTDISDGKIYSRYTVGGDAGYSDWSEISFAVTV